MEATLYTIIMDLHNEFSRITLQKSKILLYAIIHALFSSSVFEYKYYSKACIFICGDNSKQQGKELGYACGVQ